MRIDRIATGRGESQYCTTYDFWKVWKVARYCSDRKKRIQHSHLTPIADPDKSVEGK